VPNNVSLSPEYPQFCSKCPNGSRFLPEIFFARTTASLPLIQFRQHRFTVDFLGEQDLQSQHPDAIPQYLDKSPIYKKAEQSIPESDPQFATGQRSYELASSRGDTQFPVFERHYNELRWPVEQLSLRGQYHAVKDPLGYRNHFLY
jgi:hypothetical protein